MSIELDPLGLEALGTLPTVRGEGSNDGATTAREGAIDGDDGAPGLDSEPMYRYCKSVADNPMQPSSRYAALAGLSPRTAIPIRRHLVAAGLIRGHRLDSGGRGRAPLLLEPLPPATAAIHAYESNRE